MCSESSCVRRDMGHVPCRVGRGTERNVVPRHGLGGWWKHLKLTGRKKGEPMTSSTDQYQFLSIGGVIDVETESPAGPVPQFPRADPAWTTPWSASPWTVAAEAAYDDEDEDEDVDEDEFSDDEFEGEEEFEDDDEDFLEDDEEEVEEEGESDEEDDAEEDDDF